MTNASDKPPRRFTLTGLLELIAGVALFLALVTQLGGVGWWMALSGLLTICLVVFLVPRADDLAAHLRHCRWDVAVIGLIAVILGMLLWPAFQREVRGGPRMPQCSNNLRMLGLAIQAYYDTHGHFPPAYLTDANGQPTHSWRVLILPFMELEDLYRAYNFNEPWDGPNNRKLAAKMPDFFRCPTDKQLPPGMTSYFAVVGSGRTKPGKPGVELEDISDGTSNTIALVESNTARVNWLDPRELKVEDILAGENTPETPCPCSLHASRHGMWRSLGYFHAVMYDARVRTISAYVDRATLKALLTIDGGEPIGYVPGAGDTEFLWPGFLVVLAAEIAFVSFAIARRLRRRAATV